MLVSGRSARWEPGHDVVETIVAIIGRMVAEHCEEIIGWNTDRGRDVPDDVVPVIVAVEKALEPVVDPARGFTLDDDIIAAYEASVAITYALSREIHPVVWVHPHKSGHSLAAG